MFTKNGPMCLPCLLNDGSVAEFKLYVYRFDENLYYVIEKGSISNAKPPLVRIHSTCSFAHVFNSQRCDCKSQLDEAMAKIAQSDAGLIIYIWSHEGRGVGMWEHVKVYMEQDKGEDTVTSYQKLGLPVDSRDYSNAATILKDYKLKNRDALEIITI